MIDSLKKSHCNPPLMYVRDAQTKVCYISYLTEAALLNHT